MFGYALSNFLEEHPAELVYVHTDRDIYSESDTIWYKIYLFAAHSRVPEPGHNNVYVELINDTDTIKMRNLIHIYNGFGNGEINLHDYKIGSGKFILRAYTNYQQNFGNEFLFNKNILIEKLYNFQTGSTNQAMVVKNKSILNPNDVIDLQFLPEGGHLTNDVPNKLAFKAISSNGYSIDVTGWVYDSQWNKGCIVCYKA